MITVFSAWLRDATRAPSGRSPLPQLRLWSAQGEYHGPVEPWRIHYDALDLAIGADQDNRVIRIDRRGGA